LNHEIIISPKAFKDLEKIYKKYKLNYKRIKEGINEIKENPYRSSVMKHYLKGTRKIRKGDYRIIFDISGNEVVILDIMPRKKDYS
jgi:addiction module RelE/StbE family toxin